MGINLLVDILNSKKMGPLVEDPFFMLLEKIEAILLYRILVLSWIQVVGLKPYSVQLAKDRIGTVGFLHQDFKLCQACGMI